MRSSSDFIPLAGCIQQLTAALQTSHPSETLTLLSVRRAPNKKKSGGRAMSQANDTNDELWRRYWLSGCGGTASLTISKCTARNGVGYARSP